MNALADRIKSAVLGLWNPADKVFEQRDVDTGFMIPWKDQQNFSPFTEGIAPDTRRVHAGAALLRRRRPVPDHARLHGRPGRQGGRRRQPASRRRTTSPTSTRRRRRGCLGKALRDYPSPYITPDSYRKLIEWGAWTEDINGDNRFPDNNEYFSNWNAANTDVHPLEHPPQHPRRVQLHALPRHRRPPAAPRRRARAALRSTSGMTTSRSITSATTADLGHDRVAQAGGTTYYPKASDGLLALRRRPSRHHRR